MVHDAERRYDACDRSHQAIRESAVHPPHDPGHLHAGRIAPVLPCGEGGDVEVPRLNGIVTASPQKRPTLLDVNQRGWWAKSLSGRATLDYERAQHDWLPIAYFRVFEMLFYQGETGTGERELFQVVERSLLAALSLPGTRE
jgi:hypothetical protein